MKFEKMWAIVLSAVMVLSLSVAATNAEAARLGGGRSMGKQSSQVTQRQATPTTAKPAAPPATAAAPAPKKPWGAMLGGLAAGLGLAWLASSLGLGGAFSQIIMFALLALVVMVVIGFVMRKLKGSNNSQQSQTPFAFQGAGNSTTLKNYNPENVGNDASARPWERSNNMPFEANKEGAGAAVSGSMIGSGITRAQEAWGVPVGFDTEGFLTACKANFLTLQDAWDQSNLSNLRSMMTDEMLEQIKVQLADRQSHTGVGVNKTDVVMLNAQLLGIEEVNGMYMASVEFSGMIREDSAEASAFREVWNMTKPQAGGSGWLVAGVQALQ